MLSLFRHKQPEATDILNSKLFDEKQFYQTFIKDLHNCKKEVIIESPFITENRTNMLMSVFKNLLDRNIKIFVITRNSNEHDGILKEQAEKIISTFETIGVQVFLCIGNHHRKLAIIDRKILWEGSLNILSQTKSREIMRRIQSEQLTLEMFKFLEFGRYI